MSDTMPVRQACKHRRYEPHPTRLEDFDRVQSEWVNSCPGGKEIILRRPTDDEWIWDSVLEQDEVWVEADDDQE